jgi:hypothetical protein
MPRSRLVIFGLSDSSTVPLLTVMAFRCFHHLPLFLSHSECI